MNNLLEDQIAEERVNKKDKAGNGLKCKNRPKTSPVQTSSFQLDADFAQQEQPQPGPSGTTSLGESQLEMAKKVKSGKVNYFYFFLDFRSKSLNSKFSKNGFNFSLTLEWDLNSGLVKYLNSLIVK